MPFSTTYTPTRPHKAPDSVATMRPLTKNSNWNGWRSWSRLMMRGPGGAGGRRSAASLGPRNNVVIWFVAVDDQWHAGVFEDVHRRAVGLLQHLGGEHFGRLAGGDHLPVQADELGQVGGYAVQVVGGEHDSQAVAVELVEDVEDFVAGVLIPAGPRLAPAQGARPPPPRALGGEPPLPPARRRTGPTTGGTTPMIVRSSVVLPEPDGPTTPTNSPSATARSTLTRTGSEPYRQVTRSRRTRSPCSLIADTPPGRVRRRGGRKPAAPRRRRR